MAAIQVCDSVGPCRALACSGYCVRPPRAQLRRVAPVGGQRSAFEDGASGPDQAGDRRDALSQGGRAVRPRESQARPQGPSRRRRTADAQASGRPVLALGAVAPRPVALPDAWAGQAHTILHGRGGNGRRTVRPPKPATP